MFDVEKHTSLEVAVERGNSIKELLDWKVVQAKENGLPIQETVADYIGFGVENIDEKIARLTAYKDDIIEAIKQLKADKAQTMIDCKDWFIENGIDKLSGICVSSITVNPESVSVKKKFVCDVTNEDLIERNLAHYEETIEPILATIKINKKRIKDEIKW